MAKSKRLGKLPPRYSFMLNPYSETRLSRCPRCEKLTHPRKFAFLIHVLPWQPMILGKTCKYCSKCELIMMHQDELEMELALSLSRIAPEAIGQEYLVLGTVDKKTWQAGLDGDGLDEEELLASLADFKKEYELTYEPGGWYPTNEGQT